MAANGQVNKIGLGGEAGMVLVERKKQCEDDIVYRTLGVFPRQLL